MSDNFDIPKALSGTGGWLDDRFHGARGFRVLMRKVFPDHWSFMLGEIALWSFVILLLTGTFLSLFFVPSMTEVIYHGRARPGDRRQRARPRGGRRGARGGRRAEFCRTGPRRRRGRLAYAKE